MQIHNNSNKNNQSYKTFLFNFDKNIICKRKNAKENKKKVQNPREIEIMNGNCNFLKCNSDKFK